MKSFIWDISIIWRSIINLISNEEIILFNEEVEHYLSERILSHFLEQL